MITVHRYIPGYPYLDDEEFLEVQVPKAEQILDLDFVKSFKDEHFECWFRSENGSLLMAKKSWREEPVIVAVLPNGGLENTKIAVFYTSAWRW